MGKIFKRGLIALAPIAISIAVIIWLLRILEDIFRVPLQWLVGKYYFPGMGLLVAIVFIFFFGIFVNNLLLQKWTKVLDRLFIRIPLFKTIYSSIGDMMSYFHKDPSKSGRMVVVEIDELRFLAIVTRENFVDLPAGFGDDDRVSVLIPFSYQIGGFTASVPRSKIKPIDMSVEQGMRFIVTAGMVSAKQAAPPQEQK
jgi:uncharacterized membrane protein